MNSLDYRCKTESSNSTVSYICAVISAITMAFTIPLNGAIIYSIARDKRLLRRNVYFIITNIALADLACGLFTCPVSISHHLKEVGGKVPITEVKLLHLSFFLANSVAVFSMAALSVDRLGVLLYPFFYNEKVTRVRTFFILTCTWLLSIVFIMCYFWLGYIRYLCVFTIMTVMLTVIVMIGTMVLFKYRLVQSFKGEPNNMSSLAKREGSSIRGPNDLKRFSSLNIFTPMDQKITRFFLWMLLLFLINYSPAVIISTFMNICTDCLCDVVHVMRAMAFMVILTSGWLRAVLFITRLGQLRKAMRKAFRFRQAVDGETVVHYNSKITQIR